MVERIRMSAGVACGMGGLVPRGAGERSSHAVRVRVRPDRTNARHISLSYKCLYYENIYLVLFRMKIINIF